MGFLEGDVATGWAKVHDPMDVFGAQKNKRQKELEAMYGDPGMRPEYSDPTNMVNSTTGQLEEKFRVHGLADVGFNSNMDEFNKRLSGINLNKEGLEAVRKRALTQGPSEWQNLALGKQKLDEQTALEDAMASGMGQKSSAFSDMARKGGLSSGARERLASQSARDISLDQQRARRAGMGQRQDIGIEDERQKLALLTQLPGMEVQALQPELEKTRMYGTQAEAESGRKQNLDLTNRQYQTDIQRANTENLLREVARQDDARMQKYSTDMQDFAAQKQARAVAMSGGGGGKK